MPRARLSVRGGERTSEEVRPRRPVLEERRVDDSLAGRRNAARPREVGLRDIGRPGAVGGAERVGVLREKEDARRLLVEPVNEGEAAPVRGPELREEAARPVDGAPRRLVDGEIPLRSGRRGENPDLRGAQGRLRKRRAERMTARLPTMFAAIPRMTGHWPISDAVDEPDRLAAEEEEVREDGDVVRALPLPDPDRLGKVGGARSRGRRRRRGPGEPRGRCRAEAPWRTRGP